MLEINSSIDSDNPLMTTIYTSTETASDGKAVENYHNVVIIGYNNINDTYIIADPATGQWSRVTKASIEHNNLYIYQISGIKP